MLNSLRRIVQEVNAASDLGSVLELIVDRVQEAMNTEVCSIYLRDTHMRYVLMATVGLNKRAINHVSLGLNQGLVGLVAVREEPLNLEDAESHPNYRYFPETGEECYCAFLGVPITHHRKVLGVLVVQQRQKRRFDEGEEAFLVTMSAQLAAVIAHAEATGTLRNVGQKSQARFTGVAGASGVALGTCVVVSPVADLNAVPYQECESIDSELAFFAECIAAVKQDIQKLGTELEDKLNKEERVLFEAYVGMLDDRSLGGEVCAKIQAGLTAKYSWSEVIREHVKNFSRMNDPYLRERASDVRDLGSRVLGYLQQTERLTPSYPDKTILAGEELTASVLAEVPNGKLAGIVAKSGSSNSHIAILARSLGIPTVMGAVDLPFTRLEGRPLIVDGYRGAVYSDPNDDLIAQYQTIIDEDKRLIAGLDSLKDLACTTLDNHRVALWVNTGLMADAIISLERGAEGVGLYRTEVPFMLRDRFPSEEEQRQSYRDQLQAFAPHIVTMRTLDIGGDKALTYFPITEDNPFLGWRGIRVTLDHPEIFMVQIRAMLKASEGLDNLRIMLPMISSVPELSQAKAMIVRAYQELLEEGHRLKMPPIGVMVEVPAAVYQVRELAEEVDFMSVGSNDLTQYILAVDRNNARVADLYHSLHPAVLRALQQVVNGAHSRGVPVSICGELAGDPGAVLLLIAMGYDVLSMSATSLLKVKLVIRSIYLKQAQDLLAKVMLLPDAESVNKAIERAFDDCGLARLLKPSSDDLE